MRNRLAVYHRQTEPLIDYYSRWSAASTPDAPRYRKVAGVGSMNAVRDACLAALES